jgi:transposase-like protein
MEMQLSCKSLDGSCWDPGWWAQGWVASLRGLCDGGRGRREPATPRGASAIMAASDLVNLSGLMDDAKCFALVRQHRWPEGVRCPACASSAVIRDGCDDRQRPRQRYRCKACAGRFDDLTGTVLAGHHQPLRVWVLCLYFMGLNLSNRQIAQELGLDASDVQAMTERLRGGLVAKTPAVRLEGEVEIDEVYVVAGHKGQPAAVVKGGGSAAAAGWRERRAAARWRRTSLRSSA